MLRSTNPKWAEPKLGPQGIDALFRGVTKYVESRLEKGPEVELAQLGPACDGINALNFLADVECCTADCPPSSGPFVLANRQHGIPTLLSSSVSRPFAGVSGEPTVTAVDLGSGALSGRFFVDVLGNLFEGRNMGYHHGAAVVPRPNGTPIDHPPIGVQAETVETGQLRGSWTMNVEELVAHNRHDIERWNGSAWVYEASMGKPPRFSDEVLDDFYAIGNSPHFCLQDDRSALEPFGLAYPLHNFPIVSTAYTAHERALQSLWWTGTCDSNGGGYRPSSFMAASIEGYDPDSQGHTTTAVDATHYQILLCVRDPDTTGLLASVRLREVETYAATFSDRCASPIGSLPWRAGVQVRRGADDGTWVVSVIDGAKAWVYEWRRISSVISGVLTYRYVPVLLETVTLPTGSTHAGTLRVVYL